MNDIKKLVVKKYQLVDEGSLKESVMACTIIGIFATLISQPFDTVSTALQSDENHRLSTWEKAKEIAKKERKKGFYKGVVPRGVSVGSGIFVMSTASEKTKEYLSQQERTKKAGCKANLKIF